MSAPRVPTPRRHQPSRLSQMCEASRPLCPTCKGVLRRYHSAAGLSFARCDHEVTTQEPGVGGAMVARPRRCGQHVFVYGLLGAMCATTAITPGEYDRLTALLEHLQQEAERGGQELRASELARHVFAFLDVFGPIRDAIGPDRYPEVACAKCCRMRKWFDMYDDQCRYCRDGTVAPEDRGQLATAS